MSKGILRFCLLLFVQLLIYTFGKGQYYVPYKQYGVAEGLPSTHVNKIYLGRQGFLMICTDQGLSRFDGLSFRNFGSADGLSSLNVYSVARSKDSAIWICTHEGGLFRLKNGIVKKYNAQRGEISNSLIDIAIDSSQRIWLINNKNEVGILDKGVFQRLDLSGFGIGKVYHAVPHPNGSVLLATDMGLYRWQNGDVLKIPLPDANAAIYCIAVDPQGYVYCGATGKIYGLSQQGQSKTYATSPSMITLALACNTAGDVYGVGSDPGFFRIQDGKFEPCGKLAKLENTLIDDLLFDKDDNLHLATFGKGIYTIFSFDMHQYTADQGLFHDNITSITGDEKGRIFAGTYGGINVIDNDHITGDPGIQLRPDEMTSSLLYTGNTLKAGSILKVHRFDRMLSPERSPRNILCMLQTGDKILFGTWTGIRITEASATDLFANSQVIYPELVRREIYKIFQDSRRRLWFATDSGLYVNDGKSMRGFQKNSGLPYLSVNDVCEDKQGNIWAATDNGLGKYDGKRWEKFTTANGLNNNDCSALLVSQDGTLWIGTMAGINYYRNGREMNNLSIMPKSHITCLYQDVKGKIWAGSDNGLYYFLTSDKIWRRPNFHLYVIRIKVGNKFIYNTAGLSLPYSKNDLQLSFLAIDFRTPEDIIYQYRIANRQSDWMETPNRIIQFSELSPGDYTVEVRAKYRGSQIYSQAATVSFTILKPFWQEWWFILLVALMLMGAIFEFVRRRIKKIQQREQRRAKRLSRMMQLKQQAMNALVNPHFIFNSLNSIQHFINQSDSLSANRYLTRFARLIRKTMDSSGKIYTVLEDEIERLNLYLSLEKMRLGDKFNYHIEIDETIAPQEVNIPSLLVQPYVENAIWHGIMPKAEGGDVWIKFLRKGELMKITIADNGVGIKKPLEEIANKQRKNIRGMQINQERMGLMGKSTRLNARINIINLNETPGKSGTLIELILPYMHRTAEAPVD